MLNKSKIPARPVPRRRPLPPRPFTGNEALKAPPSRPSSPAPSASSSHASQDVCLLRNHKPEVALNRRDKPNRRELTRVFFSFFFFWLAVHSWFIITCSSQGSRGWRHFPSCFYGAFWIFPQYKHGPGFVASSAFQATLNCSFQSEKDKSSWVPQWYLYTAKRTTSKLPRGTLDPVGAGSHFFSLSPCSR